MHPKPVNWGLLGCLHRASCPRFFGLHIFGQRQAQPCPAALATPLLPPLPTDALIGLEVRRRLGRFIPIWLNLIVDTRFLTPSAPSPAAVLAGSACTCAGFTAASRASAVTAGLKGEFGASTPK